MRFTAYLILAATLLLWAGNWIVARAVRDDIAPGIATAGRLVVVLLDELDHQVAEIPEGV